MTTKTKQIADQALSLSPKERATLADTLLSSLDQPDTKLDALWKIEAETRLSAYKTGKAKATSLTRALAKRLGLSIYL